MAHLVETMFSARKVPWHGLGIVTDTALSSDEALKVAGLDWEVKPQPVYAELAGIMREIPGTFANVRDSDNKVIGIVSGAYKVLQNKEAFAFTDALIGEGVQYETAGALTNGRVWMMAKMPAVEIVGDKVEPYLAFTNSFDGQQAVRVICTPVRIVCNNTLTIALRGAKRSWSARHSTTFEGKLQEARETLGMASKYYSELAEYAEKLAAQKMSESEWEVFVNALFPAPEAEGRQKLNITTMRAELSARYFTAPDLANLIGTKWGALQAVTDFVSHTQPRRKTETFAEGVFAKLLDGHEVLNRATALLEA